MFSSKVTYSLVYSLLLGTDVGCGMWDEGVRVPTTGLLSLSTGSFQLLCCLPDFVQGTRAHLVLLPGVLHKVQ